MTETLIVKYSFILYSFKFLTSLPKIRDIKNNNMNVIFPRTVNVSMILEVKFAYVVFIQCVAKKYPYNNRIISIEGTFLGDTLYIRLFVYDLTSKHVPNIMYC